MVADKNNVTRNFIQSLPYVKAMQMALTKIAPGEAEMVMPYDSQFVGDPTTGVIHGGAMSALIDTCCGAAVISHPACPAGTATIDLRIDYMRPATPGEALSTRAVCYHVTQSVAFVRATAYDEDKSSPVANAAGAFTMLGRVK